MSSRNANGEELARAADSLVDVLLIPADEERAVAAELLGFEAIPVPR
jgi:acetate kinase